MVENGNRNGATVSTHNKRMHTDTFPGAGDAQVVRAREPTCGNPPTGRLPRRKTVEKKKRDEATARVRDFYDGPADTIYRTTWERTCT